MTETQTDVAVDPRVLRALGHPLRQRILHVLNARVASPSALSQELGERLANVSYHVKILLENGAIELVKTEPVRGALEHFYRATMRPYIDDAHWSKLPASSRRELFDAILQRTWDELSEAARQDRLGDPGSRVSLTRLQLDDQARSELAEQISQTLELAMRLEAESRSRLEELPPEEREMRDTALVLAHFDRADDAGEQP
jgi:DNA-binding transcriptional ArsR family regulator